MMQKAKLRAQYLGALLIVLWFPSAALSEVGFQPEVTVVSKYIWRGFDTIVDDRPAIQPSVTVTFGKSGLWFNAWSAFALADTDFVELDLIAGYDRALPKDLTLSAGVGYFTFPSMSHYPDKNSATPEIYAGLTTCALPFSPGLTLYYDFNLGDGVYATLCLTHDFDLKYKTIHTCALIGYTRQYKAIGVDPGISDICLGVSTDVDVKGFVLTPSLNYVIVPNETINDEDEVWFGLSVGWSTD